MLDKKLVHVVYSKFDRDVLVIALPAEKYVHPELSNIDLMYMYMNYIP